MNEEVKEKVDQNKENNLIQYFPNRLVCIPHFDFKHYIKYINLYILGNLKSQEET